VIKDYGRYALDQAVKLRLWIERSQHDPSYSVELTSEAIEGVVLQVLAKDLTRERDIGMKRKLEQAIRLHNLRMEEKGTVEDKA
jgi:hypothetical protein